MAEYNGILPICKPQSFTSFDAVKKLRGMLKVKKIGHAGTLDPMATGVLPVFLGNATKACDLLPDQNKAYRVTFRLGLTSDTEDIWGEILTETESHVTEAELRAAAKDFVGDIMQVPPMYSAVKVDGRRLYDIARKGVVVERKARPITVFSLDILSFDEETQTAEALVACSKGTYIRTLCADIGAKLGVGAVMTSLERTEACGFSLGDCLTFEEVQRCLEEGTLEEHILPIERAFPEIPDIYLNEFQQKLYCNGVRLDINRVKCSKVNSLYRVFGAKKEFLGVGKWNPETDELYSVKFFYQRSEG